MDPYHNIHKKPAAAAKRLAPILEARAGEQQQVELRGRVFASVLKGLPSSQPLTVVDIGCGTGALARDIARRPSVCRVVGIDPSPFLVQEAQRLAAADPHHGKLEFRKGMGNQLPVGGGFADVAFIWTVLCHVPQGEVAAILVDARRILKPGGRLVVADNELSGWRAVSYTHLTLPTTPYV